MNEFKQKCDKIKLLMTVSDAESVFQRCVNEAFRTKDLKLIKYLKKNYKYRVDFSNYANRSMLDFKEGFLEFYEDLTPTEQQKKLNYLFRVAVTYQCFETAEYLMAKKIDVRPDERKIPILVALEKSPKLLDVYCNLLENPKYYVDIHESIPQNMKELMSDVRFSETTYNILKARTECAQLQSTVAPAPKKKYKL